MIVRASILPLALLAACNPYDPSLGDQPFRCGTSDPECPAGYVCVEHSAADRFCEPEGTADPTDGGGTGDSGALDCSADSELEPNESITDPTITPIPDFGDDYDLIGLVICPEADIDVFRFRIDVTGKNGRIEVNYDSTRGTLLVDMLNSTGVSIREGTPTGGDPNKLRADVNNMAQGQYFARISGMDDAQAGYAIKIVTATGTLPP